MAKSTKETQPSETPTGFEPCHGRFARMIGHEAVIDYLHHSMASGKLPQTILFDGPSGVGKSAMAFALAKCLLAGSDEDGAAYEHHARKVESEPCLHPDLRIIVPSGAAKIIKVDDVRDALDVAWQMPIEGARRVFIIDPADRLNVSSANSLLKLLEEPPSLLTTILTAESVHAILPTIRSRASRLRLHALSDAAVAQWLVERCQAQPEVARVAALFSDGAPGRALAQLAGKSLADRDTLIREWQFFQKSGFQGLFRVAWNLAGIDQPPEILLGAWVAWLRDALVAATAPGRRDLLVNSDRAADLESEAAALGPRVLGRCLELMTEARNDARRMINRQLFFENLLLRLGPELKRAVISYQ